MIGHRRACLVAGALLLASALPASAGSGNIFVSSEKDHVITVLDGNSLEVIKQIGTAARPRHMIFSPDRKQIYAACGEGNAIDIIDIEKLELVDRIVGIDDPEVIEFSPDGKILYITLEDDAKLGLLDLAVFFARREEKPELTVAEASEDDDDEDGDDDDEDEDEEKEGKDDDDDDGPSVAGLTTIEVGEEPEGILVNPDGKTVYVTSEVANMVHVVDVAESKVRANIVAGNRPRRFALTPDGKELWVSNELSASVSIIDTASNKVIDEISFLPRGFRAQQVTPVGVIMTGDGKTAYVALGRANHVAVVSVADRKIQEYLLVGERAWNVTLDRDEQRLFVANGLSDDISLVDAEALRVVKSVPVGRVPYGILIDD